MGFHTYHNANDAIIQTQRLEYLQEKDDEDFPLFTFITWMIVLYDNCTMRCEMQVFCQIRFKQYGLEVSV